jgi:hypothetical protein
VNDHPPVTDCQPTEMGRPLSYLQIYDSSTMNRLLPRSRFIGWMAVRRLGRACLGDDIGSIVDDWSSASKA